MGNPETPTNAALLALYATFFTWPHFNGEIAAYGLGFQLYLFLRRCWPNGPAITIEQTAKVVLGALLGALLGAKVLAWAESFPLYWERLGDWRILIGGKTIVGAVLGGWVLPWPSDAWVSVIPAATSMSSR